MNLSRIFTTAVVGASLLCAFIVQSSAAPAVVPADGGRLLASGCFQCHGTNGLSGAFDTLAGDSQADMLNKLNDMRTKPAGDSIMYPHADGYSSDDLYWITLYFSKLPKP